MTAKTSKVTAVQWDGNTSLTFSELLAILCDDGGALFGRVIASRLLLKKKKTNRWQEGLLRAERSMLFPKN